jgi:hypothetical protein
LQGDLRKGALVGLLLAACASAPKEAEEPQVSRAEATAALYLQLDGVLGRRAELRDDPEAAPEREELLELAEAIVVQIARIDPQADLGSLVRRVEGER